MYMNNPRQGLPTRAMPNQQGAPQPQGDSGAPTASPAVMPGMQQAQGQGQPWDNSLQMLRHQMTGPLTPEQKAQQARDGEHYLAGIGKPPRSPQELLDSFQARPAPTNGQGKEFRNGNPFANARGEMRQPYRNMGNQVNGVMQQFGGMNPYSQVAGGMGGQFGGMGGMGMGQMNPFMSRMFQAF